MAIVMLSGSLLCAPVRSCDLVGRWTFEGCDGRIAKDLSGAGNDGVIAWGELRQEKGTTSLELDGFDGHVRIEPKDNFNLHTDLTTVLWVKATKLRNRTVLFGIPNANPDWTTPVFGMYVSGRHIVYGQFGDRGTPKVLVESKSELPLNRWTFLAAASDGEAVRLYLDGKLDAEVKQRAALGFNGNPLSIGAGLGSKPSLKGRVGELRIYDRALSANDVLGIYEATRSSYEQVPVVTSASRDGTVIVETHGTSPEGPQPWRANATRLLEKLDGYTPSGDRVKLNRYGGCLDLPREEATGFFRTQKIDGRWWLIDPEGCRFYHVAINTVREPRDVNKKLRIARAMGEEGHGAIPGERVQRTRQRRQRASATGQTAAGMGASPRFPVCLCAQRSSLWRPPARRAFQIAACRSSTRSSRRSARTTARHWRKRQMTPHCWAS